MELPSLLGNPRLKAAVSAMAQRPASPILLDGPQGSGKRTAAMDLAAALLCRSADGPCGQCPACARFQAGSHPDFHQLVYEGKAIKVVEVRELRARTFLKPQEAPFKVCLIFSADKLSVSCQNALLKVLEEPHSCAFILLCENREALLRTIRSRCTAYAMEPLPQHVLRRALEQRGFTGAELQSALDGSGGFLGQALNALSGERPPWQTCAAQLADALERSASASDELAIYSACMAAGKLDREGYDHFLAALCALLTRQVAASQDGRLITIYEYITQQQGYLPNNPSLTGMVSGLAAFCGQTMAPA